MSSSSDLATQDPAESSAGALIKRDTNEMSGVDRAEWSDDEKVVVGVVPQLGVMALRQEFRKPRWGIWQSACPVHITPDDRLQLMIDSLVPASTAGDSESPIRNRLILLVSHDVPAISFRLPLSFRTVTVLRMDLSPDTALHDTTHHLLAVDGASRFDDVRLDRWQAEGSHNIGEAESPSLPAPGRRPAIYLGRGVRIATDLAGLSPLSALLANNLTSRQRALLREAVDAMHDTNILSTEWWRTWQGKMAKILALMPETSMYVAGIKSSSAAGLLVDWSAAAPDGLLHQMARGQGLAMAAGGGGGRARLKTTVVTTVMTAAGCAQLLAAADGGGVGVDIGIGVGVGIGVGAMADYYLVPWRSVILWLQGSFTWLHDHIGLLWWRLTAFCSNALLMAQQRPGQRLSWQQQRLRPPEDEQEQEGGGKGKAVEPNIAGWKRRVTVRALYLG